MRLSLEAPAKVNLFLRILAREASGFHQLETLFCALDLADEIQVETGAESGIALDVEGADLGPAADNLVYRAARAFYDAAGIQPAARIRLLKRIPHGAGLGGGSSDAAATLLALGRIHGDPIPHTTLLDLAARLGSDVPFFLAGSPLVLAWGRGERMLALPPLPPRPVLVVAPPYASPTAQAYRELAAWRERAWSRPGGGGNLNAGGDPVPPPPQPGAARLLDLPGLASWDRVAAISGNDFEPVLFDRFPELAAIRAALQEAGAAPALLSGSGSSLFGIFDETARRDAAAQRIGERFPHCRIFRATIRGAAATRTAAGPVG